MINELLYRLSARLPCRLIHPYLERYYLGRLFSVTFYLHRFVSSDSERHLHNHPWGWGRSLVLSGSYSEESVVDLCPHAGRSGCVTRTTRVRWWNKVDGNWFHRISDVKPGTWTLFFHGKRVGVAGRPKGWGFLESVDSETTIFRPFPSGASRWWETADTGKHIGRAPLVSTVSVRSVALVALAIGSAATAALALGGVV